MSTTQAPDPDGIKRCEVLGRLPIIDAPMTRYTEHWITWQTSPCADLELDFVKCSARVGVKRTAAECKKYHDDLMECAYRIKTMKRYQEMQAELKKQGKPYMEAPPADSIRTWTKFN